jgi:hypothetical protein
VDAESVEEVGGVGVREGEFSVVVAGQRVEVLAVGLKRTKLTGIEGSFEKEHASLLPEGRRAGTFRSPPGASAREGADLGGGGLLLDLGFGRGFVGLPVFARQILVSVDCAVGGGEQGIGLHRHVGCEFAGPLRLAFEADRGPVFVIAAIGGRAVAARASPTLVE